MRDVRKDVRDLVESLQPYHRSTWPETWYLHVVNEVARIDKHRVVVPMFGRLRIETSKGQTFYREGLLRDGDRIGLVLPPGGLAEDLELTFWLTLGVIVGGHPVGAAGFLQIHDFIRDEVLPRFARLVE